jgi:hypothetical protein
MAPLATVYFAVEAMALDIPTDAHPNKLPFSGVMTKVGVASDRAPEGTNGKRTLITKKAAKVALGSVLGMAVDYVEGLDGHDPQAKIGIITAADVKGEDLAIEGFFYAADFPELVQRIRRDKAMLGFSYEAQVIDVEDRSADPWVIDRLVFTGAAVLRKDKAAYQATSLAAHAAGLKSEGYVMSRLSAADLARPTVERVRPHAERLYETADAMEADGIGCHAARGHAALLRRMADAMMSDAAVGKTPDQLIGASGSPNILFREAWPEGIDPQNPPRRRDGWPGPGDPSSGIDPRGNRYEGSLRVAAMAAAATVNAALTEQVRARAQLVARNVGRDAEVDQHGRISARAASEAMRKRGLSISTVMNAMLSLHAAGALLADHDPVAPDEDGKVSVAALKAKLRAEGRRPGEIMGQIAGLHLHGRLKP